MPRMHKDPLEPQLENERERIDFRRESLGLGVDAYKWGLGLSGGGIRSATFCQGVLQALARAPSPRRDKQAQDGAPPLLADFDYLSTVSGGGYVGSFLYSLFLPGRLRELPPRHPPAPASDARQAAMDAYGVLRQEPPGRISTSTDYQGDNILKAPGAWLRENGRYLTPTGAGDMFYALAMTWRNWLSLHLVIGMPLLLAFALLYLFRLGVTANLLLAPAALLVFAVLPLVIAYWQVIPRNDLDERPSLFNWAAGATLFMFIALAAGATLCLLLGYRPLATWHLVAAVVVALAMLAAAVLVRRMAPKHPRAGGDNGLRARLGAVIERLAGSPQGIGVLRGVVRNWLLQLAAWVRPALHDDLGPDSVRNYRVLVTRRLGQALIFTAALLYRALLGILAEELYEKLHGPWAAGVGGILPLLIWLVRKLAVFKDEKAVPGWLAKLPLDVLGLLAGVLLLSVVCLAWALFALWVGADGAACLDQDSAPLRLCLLGLSALAVALLNSQFVGFLNTSTLQPYYAARLTRAYLGASNGQRFAETDSATRKRQMSVAEPQRGDDLSVEHYYGPPTAGPLHLLNVTLNLTIDPAEQLVQRDRKGKPLCLAPSGRHLSEPAFIYDGTPQRRGPASGLASEIGMPLSIGQWVGISGAAVSTGLGRATSLGYSLVLGLANVRLGVWWPSRFEAVHDQAPGLASLLPTQTYLLYELTAHFHGHRREYQYLSDGGHFENTAGYELLRPGRDIELTLLCDCGCDADYRFDDLANLVRLARIDHHLEVREDPGVLRNPVLAKVFGSLEEFRQPPAANASKCALLFEVTDCADGEARPPRPEAPPRRWLLVLKPRRIAGMSADVFNYARDNPEFPNQTTADQFFDEAQFESYRQLGLDIGRLLFGDGQIARELWDYLGIH
ncbi:hypothetical protein QA447_17250 [Pseudomonas sp. abacavir_1]